MGQAVNCSYCAAALDTDEQQRRTGAEWLGSAARVSPWQRMLMWEDFCDPDRSSFYTEKGIRTQWFINYLISKVVIGKAEEWSSLPQHTKHTLLGESSAYKPPNRNTTLAPED